MIQPVFVFGSNLSGRHGKGAALWAKQNYNAETGIGEGMTGCSYALPTKDKNLKSRNIEEVRKSFEVFLAFAEDNPQLTFELTPFDTGLAGFAFDDIKQLVLDCDIPRNVLFTQEWIR